MKRTKFWMLTAILIFGITMTSCSSNDDNNAGGDPIQPRTDIVDYTVMLYSVGGENLDIDTERDMVRACKGLKDTDPNVRFFVQYKYSSQQGLDKQRQQEGGSYTYLGKAASVYRFELVPSQLTYGGSDLGLFTDEMLYGSQQAAAQFYQPDSIASFINYCKQAGPAKNYILIIGDHGSGYDVMGDAYKDGRGTRAVCNDGVLKNNPGISVHELREGIEKSGVHLKMVIYDDCLMNTLEVLSEYQDVADYVMASNHITTGGDFMLLDNRLQSAAGNGDFVGEIGKYMEQMMKEKYDNSLESDEVLEKFPNKKRHCDFVLTDMQKFKAVLPAMKQFTDKLVGLDSPKTLDAAEGCYQPSSGVSIYDVLSYASLMKTANTELAESVDNLTKAIEAAQAKHVYTQEVVNYLEKDDRYAPEYKKLSYLVNIGCGRSNAVGESFGLLRIAAMNEDGDISCIDNNGQYWFYDAETDMFTRDKSNADSQYSWANGYSLTAFEKATGWTRWILKNRDLPQNNPPFYFE
ncbi:MAG: hypothetical protein IJ618_07415 [Prevotella sp.]|nr:hypothetical protein [Prevotella sp.]